MEKLRFFKKIMQKSETEQVILLTNHYQITGMVYDCEECNKDGFVNLTNVSLCKYEESYGRSCEQFGETKYDWLHINLDKVVAFSFVR